MELKQNPKVQIKYIEWIRFKNFGYEVHTRTM